MVERKILRVIDVNFNRAKEGLRVVEDIARFILQDNVLRRKTRLYRHSLDKILASQAFKDLVSARDSLKDIGMATDRFEMKEKDVSNVLYANIQRVKESLRVLEEFSKIASVSDTPMIKKIRYQVYALEKNLVAKWPPLTNKKIK